MNIIKSSSDIANFLKHFRRAAKLKQRDFAQKLGLSLEDIIRIERGDNVGIELVLSVLNAMDLQLKIEEVLPENIQVVENFDEYYKKRFRLKLEDKARHESGRQGFLKSSDQKRISIVNLKKAFDI